MLEEKKSFFFLKGIDDNLKRLLGILFIIIVIASITKHNNFLKIGNFQSIGSQLSEYGLMSLGVGICMISGGIDLSTVYIANLCGIIAGLFMKYTTVNATPTTQLFLMGASIIIALIVGLLCGIFNGFLIAKLRVPAMLATLGTYQLFMGIGIVISKGSTVNGIPHSFAKIGTSTIFGFLPSSFLIFIIVAILLSFLMSRTSFGTKVYLVGTNPKSALFSGINNSSVIIKTYMISGLVSAIAGILSLSKLNSAKADFGSSFTMQCILIAVLGGINPNGGFGKVSGVAIAVIILQVISTYLNMFPDISNYYRDLIWGITLILVLIINFTISKRNSLKLSKN